MQPAPDLIIIQSVWNDMKKQNNLRQTKSRRTVATSPFGHHYKYKAKIIVRQS